MTLRIAIDIGGTFTDVILYDAGSRRLAATKVPSGAAEPALAFLKGLAEVLEISGKKPDEVRELVHGTTIVTNALLEGKTARIGLLVTRGFRDLLEIGRQQRPSLYHLDRDRPPPLVSPEDIEEIRERVSSAGEIIIPLDERDAAAKISKYEKKRVGALAVSLLFSYIRPDHERLLKKLVRRRLGKPAVFLSSEISPEFREFERTSTTVISAAVSPTVVSYLKAIQGQLKKIRKANTRLEIMHSGGGILSTEEAMKKPHTLIESGPAAGLIGAADLVSRLKLQKVIALDMGGTTAKAGLLWNGKLPFSQEYEVGGELHHGGRFRGSGYPVRTPMIDIVECGAGAGSIAWLDRGGHLKVGPRSAGADPGPACYGKGGDKPTVADAHLILGRLTPYGLMGGEIPLYPELSQKAVSRDVGRPLNMATEEAAAGILEVANASMLRILRLISVTRGHDPRNFVLLAYGGAGPMHAVELAGKLSIRHVIVPLMPGLFSTWGLLCAERSTDFVGTAMVPLEDLSVLKRLTEKLCHRARRWFERNGIEGKDRDTTLSFDLRYFHQNYELNLALSSSSLTRETIRSVRDDFHKTHAETYGLSAPGEPIQVVHVRLRASTPRPRIPHQALRLQSESNERRSPAGRSVWLKGKFRECRIFGRSELPAGRVFRGPMIIHERESTTVVEPDWTIEVDDRGLIHLRR